MKGQDNANLLNRKLLKIAAPAASIQQNRGSVMASGQVYGLDGSLKEHMAVQDEIINYKFSYWSLTETQSI